MPHPKTPVSPKQLAANRANAAKSTGPRTAPGKARSAQNARKHGFTASTFAVVRLEDLQEIAHLKEDLVALYQPVDSQELFALERITLAQQSLLRAARLEAGLFTTALNSACDCLGTPITLMNETLAGNGDIEITRQQNRNYLPGEGFQQMAHKSNSWSLFLRYQAQANATIAARSRSSSASKPCGGNCRRRNTKRTERTHFYGPRRTKYNHLRP